MNDANREAWGNPSSIHAEGRMGRAVTEEARAIVARFADVSARDVVFTSGATEANNLALFHATALVTSRIEHPSVVRVAEVLEARGTVVRWLPVPPSGRIDGDDVSRAIRNLPGGFAVALIAANHETGVLQPVREVAEIVERAGGRLHVDAAQAAGKVAEPEWRGGGSVSLGAHKLRGPKGIGALLLRGAKGIAPVLFGGAQERGLRPGTPDPALAAGFGAAVKRAAEGGIDRYARLTQLRDRLEAVASEFGAINGAEAPRLPHVTNVSFHGWRGDELAAALDLAGLSVSSGSACSAGTSEPSAVIAAMLGNERAASAIRFSLGDESTESDVEAAIDVLLRVLGRSISST